jgi:hypothetical protein
MLRGHDKFGKPILNFAALAENYQRAINAIRKSRGRPEYTDPPAGTPVTLEWILGGKTDLRTPQVARAEGLGGAKVSGTPSQVLPNVGGIEIDRSSPEYENVMIQLKAANVGGETGALDRTIVADTILGNRSGTPTLVSVDRAMVTNLAIFGTPDKIVFKPGDDHMKVLGAKFPDGKFTISINGRLLDVRFK